MMRRVRYVDPGQRGVAELQAARRSVDLAHELPERAAHLRQVDQPILFGLAVAQRQHDRAAQAALAQVQDAVDDGRIEAFHRRAIDFLEGGRDDRRTEADVGFAGIKSLNDKTACRRSAD